MLFVHRRYWEERGNDARNCKEFRGIETAVDSLKVFAIKDDGHWGRFFPFSIEDLKLWNVDWYGLLVRQTPKSTCLSSTWYSPIAMGSGIGGKEEKGLRDAHTKSKALGVKENGNEKEILSLSLSCTLCSHTLCSYMLNQSIIKIKMHVL